MTKPFQLGDWRIDPALGQAFNAGVTVKIDPRNMRVLQILADRQGSLVSLRELQSLAWDATIVTTDSLYQSIRQLRQALGDTKSPSRYIQTFPRKGYRLIAPVSAGAVKPRAGEAPQTIEILPLEEPLAANEAAIEPARTLSRRPAAYVAGAIAVVVAAVLFTRIETNQSGSAATEEVRVASSQAETLGVQQLRDRATVAMNEGRPREVIALLEPALDLQVATTGEENEIVARILVDLARAHMWLDDQQSASRSATRAVAVFDRLAPLMNPDRIGTYSVAAEVLMGIGDYATARRLLQSSFSLAEQLYGEDHVGMVEPRGQRALLNFATGHLQAAERDARDTLETIVRARGAEDFRAGHWHVILAAALMDQGRLAEAEAEAQLATEILTRVTHRTHPYVLSAKHVLAEILAKRKRRLDEAQLLVTEELQALVASGASKWRIARASGVLGEVLLLQGRREDAERHLLSARKDLATATGWPLDRESRNLDARIRELNKFRPPAVSVAKL